MADTPALTPIELEGLWADFHSTVNMTSQELADWLRTGEAGLLAEPLPEHAGSGAGRHVLAILRKRRTDLTADDIRLMHEVVGRVAELRGTEHEPAALDTAARHRLMSLGHDPLKP
ncbi:DUF3140 domain-containing protein [Streptomyces sp. KL116D]|uniref:DUF3140 domain-containing protein n=1 Tax=Streptomyces sp. KL116D TaxID=3045152 RepID=UPI003559303A